MPGWERLLTSGDAGERLLIRITLDAAVADHDDRQARRDDELQRTAEITIQRGVAQAFQ